MSAKIARQPPIQIGDASVERFDGLIDVIEGFAGLAQLLDRTASSGQSCGVDLFVRNRSHHRRIRCLRRRNE